MGDLRLIHGTGDLVVVTIVGKWNNVIDLDEGVWNRGLIPISERDVFGD